MFRPLHRCCGAAEEAPVAPTAATAPVLSGTAQVGEELTCADGTYTGTEPITVGSYQWQRSADGSTGWADISGATDAAYTPVLGDTAYYLRRGEVASNSAGSASRAYSDVSDAVADADPIWERDFATSQSLGTGGSCDRDSVGTYRDSGGIYQSASNDTARFDHDVTAYALLNEPSGAVNLYWPSASASTKGITVVSEVLAVDESTAANLSNFRTNSDWQKYANKYTPSADVAIKRLKLHLWKANAPTGNVWLEIIRVSDNTILGTSDTRDIATGITTTATQYTFTFSLPVNVSSGTAVYIALCSDFTYSSTVNVSTYTRNSDSSVWYKDAYRWSGSSWVTADSYHCISLRVEQDSGAEYVVWLHGSGSVTLSGALTGTVSAGSPVTGVASGSNTLTCTVSGSIDHLQIESGDTPTSRIITTTEAASRADETIAWTGVDADNETRLVLDGSEVDIDDWDGSLADAGFHGRISSIQVWAPGMRPDLA